MSLLFALTDIGVNLTDAMYQGEYHGSKKHKPDLDAFLERAWKHGLDKIMIPSSFKGGIKIRFVFF